MKIDLDMTQVNVLAAELAASGPKVRKAVKGVTAKGALNIKKNAAATWAGSTWAPSLARAINYDVTETATGVEAEIGPDKSKRQGPLGNIYEYGTSNNAPIPAMGPALEAESDSYVHWLGIAAAEATL